MIRPPLSHRSAPQVDHPIDETWITKKAPLKFAWVGDNPRMARRQSSHG